MGLEEKGLGIIKRKVGIRLYHLWVFLGIEKYSKGDIYKDKFDANYRKLKREYVREFVIGKFAKDPNGIEYMGKRERSSIS